MQVWQQIGIVAGILIPTVTGSFYISDVENVAKRAQFDADRAMVIAQSAITRTDGIDVLQRDVQELNRDIDRIQRDLTEQKTAISRDLDNLELLLREAIKQREQRGDSNHVITR
jgi:hypothetical protein